MSIASSQRSRRAAARLAERPVAAPGSPHESPEDREWDGRVAREVRHQEVIEATLDRAEAYARLGDFGRAVDWLDRAAAAGGDLSTTGLAQRASWIRGAEHMTAQPLSEGLAFEVKATPMAGHEARHVLLAGNGTLPGSVLDDVLLLVTELVTNAVRHSGAGPDGTVRVEVRRGTEILRVEVSDEGTGFKAEAPLERNEAGGWGLALVDRIADRWAVTHTGSGTCAWFEIGYER
jgi:anti-sigma regulatory factor (Ser/Thr protein kinase)